MTPEGFWDKVNYEGGYAAAMDYGLTPDDIDPGPVRDAWRIAWMAYRAFHAALDGVEDALREAGVSVP